MGRTVLHRVSLWKVVFTPLSPLMSGLLQRKSTLGKMYMPVDVNAATISFCYPIVVPSAEELWIEGFAHRRVYEPGAIDQAGVFQSRG